MKTLGFDDGGVETILTGEKTKTYRLGDKHTREFSVGDRVVLIRTSTQEQFGVAEILSLQSITFDEIPLITS